MSNGFPLRSALIALVALGAACTVKQDNVPSLTGPSEFGLSITITATPDSISQDGASQSAIVVFARGPNGAGILGVPLRLDIAVGGFVQDFGTLSTKSIVTGSDGRAAAVFTAPPAPPPGAGGAGNLVTIIVTPTGSNFQAANSQSVDIRLVPPGVILPPAPTPTASFTFSPAPVLVNLPINFDASSSCQGSPCTSTGITDFQWSFGDGTTASGKTTTKTFTSAGTFNVTLTVTNDRGVSASTTRAITVGSGTAPIASFVFSPSTPQILQNVSFNADASRPAAGRTIKAYSWDFGDGDPRKSGVTTTHDFATAGTFNVVLTVTDDLGQTGTDSQTVTVTGGGAPTAAFVFSPTAPQVSQSVAFNATTSRAAPGRTIASYSWNFGDGGALGTGVTPTRAFSAAGTYNVVLTVTDNVGQTGTTSQGVTVTAGTGGLTADFTFSPTDPRSGALVSFNANTSSPLSSITLFTWDFGDGTTQSTSSAQIDHTFFTPVNATFTVRLTVQDNTGRTATTTKTVAVTGGSDPTARFTLAPSPAAVNQSVEFDGFPSSAMAPATIVRYEWNFGDGSPIVSTTAPTTKTFHSYPAKGTYTIRLTVFDSSGRSGTTSHTLLVQ